MFKLFNSKTKKSRNDNVNNRNFSIISTVLGIFTALALVVWIGYSASIKNFDNIINTVEVVIITAATLTALVFTYIPIIEDKSEKSKMIKIGEFFLVATILIIIGIFVVLLFFVPFIAIGNGPLSIDNLVSLSASAPIFAAFYRGTTYFFQGIMDIYSVLQKKYPDEMWLFTPKK